MRDVTAANDLCIRLKKCLVYLRKPHNFYKAWRVEIAIQFDLRQWKAEVSLGGSVDGAFCFEPQAGGQTGGWHSGLMGFELLIKN